MLTESQKQTAQSIVNIFETGKINGEYGQVTILKGDTGHLTYGRSQTTLGSGNLYKLLALYSASDIDLNSKQLKPYMKRIKARDTSLDRDTKLHTILQSLGQNPVMQKAQDEFFDEVYWEPALKDAKKLGLVEATSICVVYDSKIHGSWGRMKRRTNLMATVESIGEKVWIQMYVDTRRNWLATHSNSLLNRTVYRMDAFKKLILENNWGLILPLTVHGRTIYPNMFTQTTLRATSPYTHGSDVKQLQQLLISAGHPCRVDGIFGHITLEKVRNYQKSRGLLPDGVVGKKTWEALLTTTNHC